jgi:glycosyltransferase involved in cell wall biosynthesis
LLLVIETHPIQYHAPVYRAIQEEFGIPVTAIYGSDFSVRGYRDPEFGAEFSWDTDLLAGYRSRFLSRVEHGGARDASGVSARGLRRVLNELKPSAVLLPGYSPRFYRLACLAAVRSRLPILFRGETTDHAVRRHPFKSWARDVALRALYRRCARLLHVGERSARHFERLGFPRSSLIFSPYCVDTSVFECGESAREKYRAVTRRQIGAAENDIVLLFSGKLSHRKGPDLLVDAIAKLPSELRSRVLLLFVGDGELRRSLESRCRPAAPAPSTLNIQHSASEMPRAFFAGFKNQRELSPFFHAADALVLPSRHGETWGLVVNEALHHGIPAVVSDAVGCAPDLITSGTTGEIFSANSAGDLAQAIIRIANYGEQTARPEDCRTRIAEFSISNAARGIAAAYRAVKDARSP